MNTLKQRIKDRTTEIIARQKKEGFYNFTPGISPEMKAALEADLKMAACVDACVEEMVELEKAILNLVEKVNVKPEQAEETGT